jgi:hypothetical protein
MGQGNVTIAHPAPAPTIVLERKTVGTEIHVLVLDMIYLNPVLILN